MPKMKTHSSAKKRFSVTGSGKISRRQAGKRHILTGKSNKRKVRLSPSATMDKKGDELRVKRMLLLN